MIISNSSNYKIDDSVRVHWSRTAMRDKQTKL